MKWIRSMLVGLSLLQVGYLPAAAQEALAVAVGTRVRVKAPSVSKHRLVGTIVSFDGDTLVVDVIKRVKRWSDSPTKPIQVSTIEEHHTQFAIPLNSVTRLEMSYRTKRKTLRYAGYGAVIVGGVAVTLFTVNGVGDPIRYYAAIEGSIVGVFLGAAVGFFNRADSWEKVPLDRLQMSLLPQRQGGLALSASFAF